MENGKKQILGHPLTWDTWGTKTYYYWYGRPLCTVEAKDFGKVILSPGKKIETLSVAETEHYTVEEVHQIVLNFFRYYKEHFKNLAAQIKAENEAYRKEQEAEKAKYYHLELDDLTHDHNLLYADILSVRSLNILKQANITTLRELSHLQRSDFAKFRNCGNSTVEEMENLLTKVGLTWGMKDSQYVDSVTLSALIEKLQAQLQEHPEYADRMVYFDQLHINGNISVLDDKAVELS